MEDLGIMANGLFSTRRGKPLSILSRQLKKSWHNVGKSLGFNFEDDLWLIKNSDEVKKKCNNWSLKEKEKMPRKTKSSSYSLSSTIRYTWNYRNSSPSLNFEVRMLARISHECTVNCLLSQTEKFLHIFSFVVVVIVLIISPFPDQGKKTKLNLNLS